MKTLTRSRPFKLLAIPALRGNLHVTGGVEPGDEQNGEVVLLGDPEGLRSLAAVLNALAELDQTTIQDLPETDAHEHFHLDPHRHLGSKSARMIVSRLDDRNGKLPTFYGKKLRSPRPIRELRQIKSV